tara:strand:- start:3880 stop:4119 length:240 start_codon:yes stop_codon:yes gene_type:complete
MYKIDNGYIHGKSYAVLLNNVEFITWRLNEDTGEYWVKLHLPSGKEIRIKVSTFGLLEITGQWANNKIEIEIGENNVDE